jgi:hypothetical protein
MGLQYVSISLDDGVRRVVSSDAEAMKIPLGKIRRCFDSVSMNVSWGEPG